MTKPENVKCPVCGGPMQPRTSQYGKFWGCEKFPQCKGKRNSMGLSREDIETTHDYDDLDSEHPGNPKFYGR